MYTVLELLSALNPLTKLPVDPQSLSADRTEQGELTDDWDWVDEFRQKPSQTSGCTPSEKESDEDRHSLDITPTLRVTHQSSPTSNRRRSSSSGKNPTKNSYYHHQDKNSESSRKLHPILAALKDKELKASKIKKKKWGRKINF